MGGGPSALARAERPYLEREHNLGIDANLRNQQRVLVEGLKSPMKLCSQEVTMSGITFHHYYLTDGSTRLEFGDTQLANRALKIYAVVPNEGHFVDKEFVFCAEAKQRVRNVLGSTNYSLALRNSEHMARYIHTGTWFSLAMSEPSALFNALKDSLGDRAQLVNTAPAELEARPPARAALVPVYPELTTPFQIEFKEKRATVSPGADDINIVVVGPTGAGKSTIINALFNRTVAKAKHCPGSVTRQMDIYSGFFAGPGQERKPLNIMDTVGFCDSVIPPEVALLIVKAFIQANMVYLDKVVVVCARRIESEQASAIKNLMRWLKYTKHRAEFVFIYNQAEDLNEVERLVAVSQMCGMLGADPRFSILLELPGSADQQVVKLAFAMGLPPRRPLQEGQPDVVDLYNAVLLRRCARTRVRVYEPDCSIL